MSQTTTAIELIRRSMLLINAIAAGETPADADLNDALTTLNEMIDSWDLQPLALYGSPNESFVLTPGKSVYDWGISAGAGNVTSERPVFLNNVTCVRAGITTPVDIVTQDQYDSIGLKSMAQPLIEKVLYVNSFPLGQLVCYPVPTEAVTLSMNVGRQLQGPITLQDTIAMPPGYLRALRYNLAVELWPEYISTGTDINSIKEIAKTSLGRIKVANSDITPSTFDHVPGVDSSRSWDWRS
jgi:hypothetical protein